MRGGGGREVWVLADRAGWLVIIMCEMMGGRGEGSVGADHA